MSTKEYTAHVKLKFTVETMHENDSNAPDLDNVHVLGLMRGGWPTMQFSASDLHQSYIGKEGVDYVIISTEILGLGFDDHRIPMRLVCPACGELHIDEGEFATKPHHTHACQHCGNVWRPAIEHTVGVRFLPGFKNAPGYAPTDEDVSEVAREFRSTMSALTGRKP